MQLNPVHQQQRSINLETPDFLNSVGTPEGGRSFLASLDAAQFADAATREIVTQAGTPKEKRFTGQSYLFNYGLPHFFFHTTTAYALLRHNGVAVGKKDYVGTY